MGKTGEANWSKVGSGTAFTLTVLAFSMCAPLFSMCVYLEQKGHELVIPWYNSTARKTRPEPVSGEPWGGQAEVSLCTHSPFALSANERVTALLWLMCNCTFNTSSCPSCLFACACVLSLKCHQALHSAMLGKRKTTVLALIHSHPGLDTARLLQSKLITKFVMHL